MEAPDTSEHQKQDLSSPCVTRRGDLSLHVLAYMPWDMDNPCINGGKVTSLSMLGCNEPGC